MNIDVSTLLCEHNKVNPAMIESMRRISKRAFELIPKDVQFSQILSSNDENVKIQKKKKTKKEHK